MELLFRYEKFSNFANTVEEQALHLALPRTWDDRFEGFLFKALKDPRGVRRVIAFLEARGWDPTNIQLIRVLETSYFAQCWTRAPNEPALWDRYSTPDKQTIRVEICREDVAKLRAGEVIPRALDIRYVDSLDLEDELKQVVSDEGRKVDVLKMLGVKRKMYLFEQEVRIFLFDLFVNLSKKEEEAALWRAVAPSIKRIRGAATRRDILASTQITPFRKLSFEGIPLIRSVSVHPGATRAHRSSVESFCRAHNLNFIG